MLKQKNLINSQPQEMPDQVEMLALSNEPAQSDLSAAAPPRGAIPCGSVEELATAMKQFTESLHQKGATVVSWINTVEPMATDRAKQFLSSILICCYCSPCCCLQVCG